jgi:predicted DNA-binding transcriptional regulator AlpA
VKFDLTMSAKESSTVWSCSEWTVYEMVRNRTCPVEPLHLGRKLRWPTAQVLASVGLLYDPVTGLALVGLGDQVTLGSTPGVVAALHALPTDLTRVGTDAG